MLCSMEFLKFCFLEIVYFCSARKSAADISACGNVQIMREYFTRKLVCAHCGRNYQRRLNNGKLAWQCYTYMVRGKKYCPPKQIHESILENVSAQVLGLPKFDNAVFQKEIRCIHVYPENRLVYEFYDGHTKEAYWKDPSRRDSWTPEMKARAAEQMRRRHAK